jgi:hypothetical protein
MVLGAALAVPYVLKQHRVAAAPAAA